MIYKYFSQPFLLVSFYQGPIDRKVSKPLPIINRFKENKYRTQNSSEDQSIQSKLNDYGLYKYIRTAISVFPQLKILTTSVFVLTHKYTLSLA